jgi:hypothetical protein
VWVAVVGSGARRGDEEMGEKLGFVKAGKRESGEDGSGWAGNRGFGDGWREILDGDVGKRDTLKGDFFELAVAVLRVLGLRAFYDVVKDVEDVGWGDGGVKGGDDGDDGRGAILVVTRVVTIWAWIVPGIEEVFDDLGDSGGVGEGDGRD